MGLRGGKYCSRRGEENRYPLIGKKSMVTTHLYAERVYGMYEHLLSVEQHAHTHPPTKEQYLAFDSHSTKGEEGENVF